jgi:hypothetical protein
VGHVFVVRSGPIFIRGSRGSRPLLFPHLCQRKSCAHGDYIEDGMRWIGRQTQLVKLFPNSNAHARWIEVGALLGQLLASLFGTKFFMREALDVTIDQVTCAGQRHMSMEHEFQLRRGGATKRGPISQKVPSRRTGYTSYRSADELSSLGSALTRPAPCTARIVHRPRGGWDGVSFFSDLHRFH